MKRKIIFNPFEKFSEKTLLIFGLIAAVVGSWLASVFSVAYNGVFDLHLIGKISFLQSLFFNFLSITILFVFLFLLGIFINKKTRAIDVLNAVLVFRLPYYFAALLFGIPAVKVFNEKLTTQLSDLNNLHPEIPTLIFMLIFGLLILLLMIWSIVLLVFGFKTATNVRKTAHFIGFVVALILAEILSKILLFLN